MRNLTGWLIGFTFLLGVGNTGITEERGAPIEEVIVVFKTHFDIGYTDFANLVVENYRTRMIDQALAVCDDSHSLSEDQRFVWTLPGWPMSRILGETQQGDRYARILKAFQEGRFVTHALPFTLHTESLELEELVRGMEFSTRLSRQAGLPLPRDAKMTDVPSHSWVIPTLLKNAGVDFLHLGCNAASSSPDVPMLFWWEGPDGSRVLTLYNAQYYGSDLLPPKDWPFKTWLALIHTNDNEGPPTTDQVRALLQRANDELPGVKIRMGRLSDFGDAIRKENPSLPVIRGDMPDTWIHGVMSMPKETGIARKYRPKIYTLESLSTMVAQWGISEGSNRNAIADSYEEGLLFGEHTWGMNFGYHGARRYGEEWQQDRREGLYENDEVSWREKGAHSEQVRQRVLPRLHATLQSLAQAVKIEEPRIVVYNPLPWTRTGVVSIEIIGEKPKSLKDPEREEWLPVGCRGNRIHFVARDVPPMGYRTYVFGDDGQKRTELRQDSKSHTIENSFFQLQFDPARGAIISLIEKRTGKEWVDASSPFSLGEYLYERFSRDNVESYLNSYDKINVDWSRNDLGKRDLSPSNEIPYHAISAKNFSMKIQQDNVSISAILFSQEHGIGLTVTLYEENPYIDVTWSIENKPADPWPEAGWLCFPMKFDSPSFKLWRLGGIVDPSTDLVRSANHDVFCLNGGMAILGEDESGIGFCAVDSPLISLERPGLWRYSRDFVPRISTVFVNLFNNQWSTNFQEWIEGSWTSTVRLWSIAKFDSESSLISPSLEARYPLEAAYASGKSGTCPLSQHGVTLSRKGVQITRFSVNPDGSGFLLRLWEQAGTSGSCTVTLPETMPVGIAKLVDLRGQSRVSNDPKDDPVIPISNHRFSVNLSANCPVSLIMQ